MKEKDDFFCEYLLGLLKNHANGGWKSARAVDRSVQTPESIGPREGLLLEGELQVHYHE